MEQIKEFLAKIDKAIYDAKVNEAIDKVFDAVLGFLDKNIPALRGGSAPKKDEK